MFATAAIFLLGNAALTALLVPYTGTVLHAGASTLGLLFAALGVGCLAGAPLSRAVAACLSDRTVMISSMAVLSAVFAITFNTHNIAWALVLFVLIGPPGVRFLVTVDTYLARRTPDGGHQPVAAGRARPRGAVRTRPPRPNGPPHRLSAGASRR